MTDKELALEIAKGLVENGFTLVATGGTYKAINDAGIDCQKVLKVSEGRPNITDLLANSEISMAINTSEAKESHQKMMVKK